MGNGAGDGIRTRTTEGEPRYRALKARVLPLHYARSTSRLQSLSGARETFKVLFGTGSANPLDIPCLPDKNREERLYRRRFRRCPRRERSARRSSRFTHLSVTPRGSSLRTGEPGEQAPYGRTASDAADGVWRMVTRFGAGQCPGGRRQLSAISYLTSGWLRYSEGASRCGRRWWH